MGNSLNEKLLNALLDSHERALQAKEETIREQREQLAFLTDGRSVDEIRAERERRHLSLQRRLELLEECSIKSKWFAGKRQREIIQELKQIQL